MLGAFVFGFGIAFAVIFVFALPGWLKLLLLAIIVASVIWYIATTRRHDRRNVSGAQLEDDLDDAGVQYLTGRERFKNRFRGGHYQPRSEIDRLYPRDDHH